MFSQLICFVCPYLLSCCSFPGSFCEPIVQTMRESRNESERERKNPHWCSYARSRRNKIEYSVCVPVQQAFLFFLPLQPCERGTWESGYFVTRRRLKSLSANLVWESRVLLCSPAGEISLCGIALHTLWLGGDAAGNTLWRLFCLDATR